MSVTIRTESALQTELEDEISKDMTENLPETFELTDDSGGSCNNSCT